VGAVRGGDRDGVAVADARQQLRLPRAKNKLERAVRLLVTLLLQLIA
jgi:hypothetical protein